MRTVDTGIGCFAASVLIFLGVASAWITHVVYALTHALAHDSTWQDWAFLALGCFVPPLGVIHGFMIWFGVGINP